MIENVTLPYIMKSINSMILLGSHYMIVILQDVQKNLSTSENIKAFLPHLCEQLSPLIRDCHNLLKDVHSLQRNLNHNVQKYLYQKKYGNALQTVEDYMIDYPIKIISQQALSLIQKAVPYCDDELLQLIMLVCEELPFAECSIDLVFLPLTKLYAELIHKINGALTAGAPQVQLTCYYIKSKKHLEEMDLILGKYFITIQENAPNFMRQIKKCHNDRRLIADLFKIQL